MKDEACAMVLKLKPGITKGEVREMLEMLRKYAYPGSLDRPVEHIVHKYDPEYGDPVWYIP